MREGGLATPLVSSFVSGSLNADVAVAHAAAEATVPTLDDDGQTRISHLVGVLASVRLNQTHIRAGDAVGESIELAVGAVAVQINGDGGDERRTELVAILHSEISESEY